MAKNPKALMMLVLSVSLVTGAVLMGGCIGKEIEAPNQTIGDITPQEAFTLLQENKNNPDFVIIDIQAPEYFANEHIENAINIYYFSETFRDELDKLDKNKTYLIYYTCRCGEVDIKALRIMKGLNFREVYNILGGFVRWEAKGLPTVK
ncbi:Thiosulfate sulfurtransferase GlpE [subsurface metagenome]